MAFWLIDEHHSLTPVQPEPKTLLGFGSPQPFVPLYAVVLGKGGHVFMNVICIVALWLVSSPHPARYPILIISQNTAIAIIAASRLVFAVARDGVLPFSGWVSRVYSGQPRNAVIVVWAVAALVTCTILPSNVAFTSLVSAAGVPSAAAYGLICLGRLLCTPTRFPTPQWSLGRWSKPFQFIGVFWNGWVVAVLFSPYMWPVNGQNLNCKMHHSYWGRYSVPISGPLTTILSLFVSIISVRTLTFTDAPIIMAGVTILALVCYFVMPEEAWLPRNRISHFIDSKGVVTETVEEVRPGESRGSQ